MMAANGTPSKFLCEGDLFLKIIVILNIGIFHPAFTAKNGLLQISLDLYLIHAIYILL